MSNSGKPIVLLVSGEYPPFTAWGGNAYQFAHLAKLLHREGYDVEVIAESDNDEEFMHLDEVGNLVHRVAPGRSFAFKALRSVAEPLARRVSFRNLMFAARVAEKALELKHIWNRRILWTETTNWRAETFLLHLFPELNARSVVRIVTPMEEVVRQNNVDRRERETQAALLQELLQQFLLRHRLYSNHEYREYFEERVRTRFAFRKPANERVFLLPFDFERVPVQKPRERSSREVGCYRLLMIGRIEGRKGFDTVCSALAGLTPEQRRRVRIVAVGRDAPLGPFQSYQKLLLQKYPGLADQFIEFKGSVSESELREIYSTVDGGLVASTSESFGYNLVELLASDLPVITSDVGAASEFERRGIRYLGKFKTAAELTAIFRDLPQRFERYRAERPQNRAALEQIYADNDRDYLQYVRSEVALPHPWAVSGRSVRRIAPPVESADLVVCSYNRFDELMLSLPSMLHEVDATSKAGIPSTVTIVYQNDGLPERVFAQRPDWRGHQGLRFVRSSPPSLTRARNTGVRNTQGDLVVFVDDDVILEPGFLRAHVDAANRFPWAIGVVGRVQSRMQGQQVSHYRAVGQIRPSGFIDSHFDSIRTDVILVPQTPMGANMAYRRAPMNAMFGDDWFDERFVGSAFREESTLATEIFRRGAQFVYAPNAALYHFESVSGGCENRNKRTLAQSVKHYALDYLFLNHLYAPVPAARTVGPLLLLLRDLKDAHDRKAKLKKAYVNFRGYFQGRRLFEQKKPALPPESTPTAEPKRPVTIVLRVSA